MTDFFYLDQTLHGYDDGHRLLKTSQKLTQSVDRTLLVMSDMSGSSMVNGFESYLTGYPLPEMKSYAIARTWYAPEMKRPGCVWTHTLLIENADLAHIEDLSILNAHFIRPSASSNSWSEYENKKKITTDISKTPNRSLIDRDLVTEIVSALYGNSELQIFLPVFESSAEYENTTFAIWSQQWAKLRRTFSFCTGAIADRKLPERLMDWQIVPYSTQREISLNVPNSVFIETDKSNADNIPSWIETSVSDLYLKDTNLRIFLRTFGAETKRGRADFKGLIEIYQLMSAKSASEEQVSRLVDSVAKLYPNTPDGARTKSLLFGDKSELAKEGRLMRHQSLELYILKALCTTAFSDAYDPEGLHIARRAEILFRDNPERALKIGTELDQTFPNKIGKAFLSGLSNQLVGTEAFRLTELEFDLYLLFFKQFKQLATSPNVWKGTKLQQEQLYNVFTTGPELPSEFVRQVIEAMLTAKSDELASEMGDRYPELTVNALLEWSSQKSIEQLLQMGEGWKYQLMQKSFHVFDWLRRNPTPPNSVLLLLCEILDPFSVELRRIGCAPWMKLLDEVDTFWEETLVNAAVFLLAFAFQNPTGSPYILVEQSFLIVHQAAERDQIPGTKWELLSSSAPPHSGIAPWDHCARLRTALIEHYMRFTWPEQSLLRCLTNKAILEKLIDEVYYQRPFFDKQHKFIRKLARRIKAGRFVCDREQYNLLVGVLRSWA